MNYGKSASRFRPRRSPTVPASGKLPTPPGPARPGADSHPAASKPSITPATSTDPPFRGREVDTAGDGFLIAFDGAARAVQCATAIRTNLRRLGVEIRSGVHAGECEESGGKLVGIAVHIGSRLVGIAHPGEILVSSTVKDLAAGSGIEFDDRGEHTLKGIAGPWHLYTAQTPSPS